jgi:hypothetical protein
MTVDIRTFHHEIFHWLKVMYILQMDRATVLTNIRVHRNVEENSNYCVHDANFCGSLLSV